MKALLFLCIAASVLLPMRWVAGTLLGVWIFQRLLPPTLATIVQAGPLALSPADLLIALLAAKALVLVAVRRELVVDRPLYLALGGYLAVNLISTLAAGWKFDQGQFVRCATSWARFVSELLILPVLAQVIQTVPQLKFALRLLLGTLAVVAVIQFVNYAGASHGIIIGEVQGAERGEVRYFGPIGDSVGMVLLLGYLVALCRGNIPGVLLFLGGIVVTVGFGAILTTVVGTVIFLAVATRTEVVREAAVRTAWLLPLLALGGVVGVLLFARPMARTFFDRITSGSYATSGVQRSASVRLAGAMIVDNPILGVGYMGYERALSRYGGEKYFDLSHPDGATANANNQIAQCLADGGVLGLIAFFGVVIAAARLLWRLSQSEDRLVATCFLGTFLWLLAQLVGNQAATWLNPSAFVARLLWVTLGLAVAAARLLPAGGPQPATSTERGLDAAPMPA